MYSFYGGKQGRSYKLTAHFDSIYDMFQAFSKGGSYTDVNYDEYVIIDTIIRKNEKNNAENGIIYRRGYDFSQEFNPENVTLNTDHSLSPNDLTDTEIVLYYNAIDVEYEKGELTTGTYSIRRKVPKYYNYHYKITSNNEVELTINNDDFNTNHWNDDWNKFVQHPGAGAIYVGQIVGPEGDSPAVQLISWDELIDYAWSDEGLGQAEPIKNKTIINPKPGYDTTAANQDGYDANGFHDTVQYGHCTLRDAQGNVQGAYIAFDIPYTVFNFDASSVSPYDTNYGSYDDITEIWSYTNLITENEDSLEHPFYKHFHISIPKGIHGRDLEDLSIQEYGEEQEDQHLQYLTYRYKDYGVEANPEPSQYYQLAPYKVITRLTPLYQVGTYNYTNEQGQIRSVIYNYPNRLKVSYTFGEPDIFDYQMIERVWYQTENNDSQNLLKGHIYIHLSTNRRIDCGLIKQVDHIEKNVADNEYYTYYNDGSSSLLPVSEIEEITFKGDLFLIRFKHIDDIAFLQNYEYQGKMWLNLGTMVKGNHIFTNFNTIDDLLTQYPYGLDRDITGEILDDLANRAGWLVTVGHNTDIIIDSTTGITVDETNAYIENGQIILTPDSSYTDTNDLIIQSPSSYKTYAYDYLAGIWYAIQDLGAGNVRPEYSILIAKARSNNIDLPDSNDINQLNNKGVWFVVTE